MSNEYNLKQTSNENREVDPILNSLNLHQKNCIPGSKEIYSLQTRSWKLKRFEKSE